MEKRAVITIDQGDPERLKIVEDFDRVSKKMGINQRTSAIFVAMREYVKNHEDEA